MPTLDEFKKIKEKKEKNFKPKRYAPYLLQEELVSDAGMDLIYTIPVKREEEKKRLIKSQKKWFKPNLVKTETHYIPEGINTDEPVYEDNLINRISKLYGIQKNLFFFIFKACKENNGLITYPLTAETLVEASGTTYKTMKKILKRLLEQDLIIRAKGRRGRGGFSIFGITCEVEEVVSNYIGILNNNYLDRQHYLKNSGIIVSEENLPADWSHINFMPLEHVGFSSTQLKQLYKLDSLTPKIVQESINHFAYGLKYNENTKKYKGDALNVFMGVLRKSQAWIEPNYRSPQEFALEKLIEQKKEEQNRYNQKIEELSFLEFPVWHKKLSAHQIKEIVPETFRLTRVPQDVVEYLKKYFKENVLIPRLKEEGILI